MGGGRLQEDPLRQALVLAGQVALGVGRAGLDDGDVDRDRRVEEVLLAAERDELDELVLGRRVEAAAVARGSANVSTPTVVVKPRRPAPVARSVWKMAFAGQQ